MRSNNKLKEIGIKNRVCYYFDNIINGTKENSNNILIHKKYENISLYDISHKSPSGPKPLRIRFDKIGVFITYLDGKVKHLVLFHYGLPDKICDKIECLISKKNGITNSIIIVYNSFGKIRIDSYNSLAIKKILTFHVIMPTNSVVNKNEDKYYYNIFLEKGSCKYKFQ